MEKTKKKSVSHSGDILQPPHSIEAEQGVVGAILLDPDSIEKIANLISVNDLYSSDHRLIMGAALALYDRGHAIDVITVAEELKKNDWLEQVGGTQYLNALAQNTPSAANVTHHAEIIREKSALRKLAAIASNLLRDSYNPGELMAADILGQAEQQLFEIANAGARSQKALEPILPIISKVVDEIDRLFNSDNPDGIIGTPSGFTELDTFTQGLHPGDLIIVAGRPSMGKTSLAMNIAEHVAIKERLPVAVFSMEMASTQIALRTLGSVGRLDQQRLRTGKLHDDDWQRLTYAVGVMQDTPAYIDETPALTSTELRSRARSLYRQCGNKLGLIVIDYLQLMSGPNQRPGSRSEEVSEFSRAIKALAKELQVPIIALSQLNRSLETRTSKRPVMSDLRESGALEQDADLILFIYRDEAYNPDTQDTGIAEIIIGKQRNGPTGTIRLAFEKEYTKFSNLTSHGHHYHTGQVD